jgi:hypothetical protein
MEVLKTKVGGAQCHRQGFQYRRAGYHLSHAAQAMQASKYGNAYAQRIIVTGSKEAPTV